MPTPRPLTVFVAGLVFTVLLLILPFAHLGLRLSALVVLLLAWPGAVLIALLGYARLPALTHLAFPLAHLPLLTTHPELAGPKIYGGPTGFIALLAVAAAGLAFFIATTPRLAPRRSRPEPLVLVGALLALAPTLALLAPALGTTETPWGALLCILLGPLVAWWLVARDLAQGVVLPSIDPALRMRSLYLLREQTRPSTSRLVFAVVSSALAIALSALWYLWSPR